MNDSTETGGETAQSESWWKRLSSGHGGEEEGIVRIQEYINHYDTRVICEFDTGA